LYLQEAAPEAEEFFGRNLDAFWDALSAGGPGYPSNAKLARIINTDSLKRIRDGEIYQKLVDIATDLKGCGHANITFEIE